MPRGVKGFQKGLSGFWKDKKRPNLFSKETLNKMKERMVGEKNPAFGKHYPNSGWQKGHKDLGTVESHKRQGEKLKKIGHKPPCLIGEKNNFWKGGITPENKKIRQGIEFRLWREAVFARDNWTCQKCNVRGSKLHPHHIKGFAEFIELRFAIDNGITLCEDCHLKLHGLKKL